MLNKMLNIIWLKLISKQKKKKNNKCSIRLKFKIKCIDNYKLYKYVPSVWWSRV